jgi:hypothetical protein
MRHNPITSMSEIELQTGIIFERKRILQLLEKVPTNEQGIPTTPLTELINLIKEESK